jgi:hypothetical protein
MPNKIEQEPDQEYLINKTTIGGADESKLYDQTLKKKVYIGLPSNKFSIITLISIVIIALAATSFFVFDYFRKTSQTEQPQQNIGITNIIEQPVKIDITTPPLNTRQKIMQIVTPFDIQSDEFIVTLQNFDISNNQAILDFLNKNKFEAINKELIEFKTILDNETLTEKVENN